MEDVTATAQHITDVASAEAHAELVAAFHNRLRLLKVPAVRTEFTTLQFYSHEETWEDDE